MRIWNSVAGPLPRLLLRRTARLAPAAMRL